MKRLLIVLAVSMLAMPAFAGIGIHINYDMAVIEEETRTFRFPNDPGTWPSVTLVREEASNPVGAGLDMTFGMLPVIDLMLSLEATFASYNFQYIPPAESGMDMQDEEFGYMRIGADFSALVDVISFPPMASVITVAVGVGPSVMIQSPIISEELVREKIGSADMELELSDLSDDPEVQIGGHAVARVHISPPVLPFGIRVMGKYYVLPNVEDPSPGSWFTVSAGIYLFN